MRPLRRIFCLLAAHAAGACAAQDAHEPGAMAHAKDHLLQMHGNSLNYLVIGERLENQVHDGESSLVWEAQGWFGYDINKLWVKTEGLYDSETNHTKDLELHALWSHAIAPYWDVQVGWRHDFEYSSRNYAVIGLMGLAPYWFEVDATAFLSDDGDASARLEAEYELRFSQRLILQPRVELNYDFSNVSEASFGQGMHTGEFGLRLRYEFRREIAPYLGVTWKKTWGGETSIMQTTKQNTNETSIVLGVRAWY
jgi:copper resistance protein B